MLIPLRTFTGEFPRTNANLIADNASQQATDCDFLAGSLRGLSNDDPVAGIAGANIKSLFVYEGGAASGRSYWWNRDVDAVRSPVVNDTYARFYWSDGSNFWVSRGDIGGNGEPSTTNRYLVGVPRPAAMVVTENKFAFPGVVTATVEICDERSDGTTYNCTPVAVTLGAHTATGVTYHFTARAAAPVSTVGTSTELAAGEDTTSTSFIAPTVGPVAKLSITMESGGVLNALVRPDSNKTTWPVELPGISAKLDYNGTSFTITFGVASNAVEYRAYVCTYVNQYGEEGAPSDPVEVECAEGSSLTLTYAPPPDGYCPITRVRVYRTASGGGANYLYVGEGIVDALAPTFADAVKSEALGHTLDTMNYYPPSQTLRGITTMANGIVVGFTGNEVHFMEPYLPYACNPNAIKPFPHRVVGICPFEGGLYVTTTADPYIIQGAAPEYMTDMKVPTPQAGVSKGSITSYNGQIVYASSDGLVMVQGLQASLDMSFKFFSRNDWQARYGNKLTNMRLNAHDGSLLVWFDDGTPGFLIRFEEEAASLTRLTQPYYAAFQHPVADALYVSNGNTVYEFRAGTTRKSLTWWSKDFIVPKPTNFGVMQLVGSGALTLTVYADGAVKHTEALTLSDTGMTLARLPSGFLARRWSFKFVGDAEINEAYLANSAGELQNG